ncbi:MAG: MurR/RpiR family transcriptional regulator [Oscillospiraceae bacterium]|nr:MurR/RpiR family transcriptional regulator [Oscillospiraceae bacterium]
MNQDILVQIQENMSSFSKGQKRIASFIMSSYDKAAFMTASKLGQTANVSESTVVRFAAELGYDGYPSMQKSLQKMIRNRLTSVQRIEMANDQIDNQDIVASVLRSDISMLRSTIEELDRGMFDRAVTAILEGRRIYIMGVRSASAISHFLAFYLNLICDNVCEISASTTSEVFEQILRIGPEDVFIGACFPRYSSRTIKAMQYAHDQGAKVIAITDSELSPAAAKADITLVARSDMASFVDSLVAPLSVVNALLVAVSQKCNENVSDTFSRLEHIWDEYDVYEKTER